MLHMVLIEVNCLQRNIAELAGVVESKGKSRHTLLRRKFDSLQLKNGIPSFN